MIDDPNRISSLLNAILYKNPDVTLTNINLAFNNLATGDKFELSIGVDPDIGTIEISVDPDEYEVDSDDLKPADLYMFNTACGFDMYIDARHCRTWALQSSLTNCNPTESVPHGNCQNHVEILENG